MIYVYHFQTKLSGHAQHYIGSSPDPFGRIIEHKRGRGARITQVCNERGIHYTLVGVYPGGRQEERAMKNQKNHKRFCPICSPQHNSKRWKLQSQS
jgi:predicted GIY-YIG superfamily endonuclease